MKPLQIVRATDAGAAAAAGVIGPIARVEGLPLHAAAAEPSWSAREHAAIRRTGQSTDARATAQGAPGGRRGGRRSERRTCRFGRRPAAMPLPDGFAPYAWAATVAEVAARHGLAPAGPKFDQNTPALPGVAQIPLAESFATLNAYPDGTYRELREAAAAFVSREGDVAVAPSQIVVGAGADDLILLCARTYLAPGRTASIVPPTYALYRIATMLAGGIPSPARTAPTVQASSGAATRTTQRAS